MDNKLLIILLGIAIGIQARALTDPTKPVRLEKGGLVTFVSDGTQMVLVSQDRQFALVEGSYVTVGDKTKLGEVVAITDEGVEVLDFKKGKISMLTVSGETVKIKTKVEK